MMSYNTAEKSVLAQFVIPAKAEIQIFLFCSTMDAHFRGHDNFLFKLSHYREVMPSLLTIRIPFC